MRFVHERRPPTFPDGRRYIAKGATKNGGQIASFAEKLLMQDWTGDARRSSHAISRRGYDEERVGFGIAAVDIWMRIRVL